MGKKETIISRIENFSDSIHSDCYLFLGSFPSENGAVFRVWAPAATGVCVVGDFNGWDISAAPMRSVGTGLKNLTLINMQLLQRMVRLP